MENSFASEAEIKWKAQLKITDYKQMNKMTGEPLKVSLEYGWIQTNDASNGNPLNLTAVVTDHRTSISAQIRVLNDLETASPKSWGITTTGYVTGVNASNVTSLVNVYNTQFSPRGRMFLMGRTENSAFQNPQ